ncbi:MAG: hypothetical protein HZA08_01380 [Nitrospirae bacterium]|nr:hypothetical protein [Nitrospirota bacterium]
MFIRPLRRGKKTPPIHIYEDRRDILVPLIFLSWFDRFTMTPWMSS